MEDELFYKDICNKVFSACLARLKPRELDMVIRYYLSNSGETLDSIGKSYKITRERVREILKNSRRKIRGYILHPDSPLKELYYDYHTTECGLDGFYELIQQHYNRG